MQTKRLLIIAIISLTAYVLLTKFTPNKSQSTTRPDHSSQNTTPEGALPNERLISFSDSTSLENFLRSIEGSSVKLLGRSNYSNTLRIGFSNFADLAKRLPAEASTLYNFPVTPPPIEQGSINPNAEPFQGRMKEWMGIFSDNTAWGEGVTVAVLDTGIIPHTAFGDDVKSLSVTGSLGNSETNSHGTAMASLWRSSDGNIPAIAPAVDLISIQTMDDTGASNLFNLSEAIYLAVEEGAQIIPISMGASSTNSLLDGAISYARDNGALIIASAGNSGIDTPFYPAAHPDTLSIAAIDYYRNHPGFSNTGDTLSFTAPGVGVLTADTNGGYALSSGTSPAAQIAGNVIAASMSELGISDPYEAWEIVSENLNELGVTGQDSLFGIGYPQMDVILNYDQAGRYDAAIASTLYASNPQTGTGEMQIVVSNPGTENLTGATLAFDVAGSSYTTPIPTIESGESHDFTIPLPLPANNSEQPVTITSKVLLPDGTIDVRPRDNIVSARF